MSNLNEKLVSLLFDTNAVRVCPENQPFWYTSGAIGPYYINTHFLYGNEEKANELLAEIDKEKQNKLICPQKILQLTQQNYSNDSIYKEVIDEMVQFIRDNMDITQIDYISGGERRDWYFSLIVAEMLGKQHITIYKDMSMVVSHEGKIQEINDLMGKNILHVADLMNTASSYERAWIPAISSKNGQMKWSLVVVDRKQGGEEILNNQGLQSYAMVAIDRSLFEKALKMERISKDQYEMIINYIENPKESMKEFLKSHPEFMENSLNADPKTRDRARMCIEKGIYE